MIDLVVATSNPHKVEEIRAVFASEMGEGVEGVRLLGLKDLGVATREPEETGSTFEANATIKAISYAEQTGAMCLADDSGLEIDALDGRPGVISSHYCTDGREVGMSRAERDAKNNERVLREMEGVPELGRTARFVCVMVLAVPLCPPDSRAPSAVSDSAADLYRGASSPPHVFLSFLADQRASSPRAFPARLVPGTFQLPACLPTDRIPAQSRRTHDVARPFSLAHKPDPPAQFSRASTTLVRRFRSLRPSAFAFSPPRASAHA